MAGRLKRYAMTLLEELNRRSYAAACEWDLMMIWRHHLDARDLTGAERGGAADLFAKHVQRTAECPCRCR